jgi:hypothetical protein
VLVVTAYAMGTLYERNQKSLKELKDGYDGMLVILQQFLCNQKSSEADSLRVSSYATQIAGALGLDPESSEDLRTAALLRNVNEIGIRNEILYKAANLSQEELERGRRKGNNDGATQAQRMGGFTAPRDSDSGGGPATAREWRQSRELNGRSADPDLGREV